MTMVLVLDSSPLLLLTGKYRIPWGINYHRFIIRGFRVYREMTTVELKVKGMTCPHCEMRVKKALEAVSGVKSAKPDHKSGTVVVEADSVSTDALVKAVNDTELYTAEA
jgi:copper chaperone CopZ